MPRLENLLGGFAKGFAQARTMKSQREQDKELNKLRSEQMKVNLELAKTKKAEQDFKNLIMQSPKVQEILGINPGAGEAAKTPYKETSFGESFGKEKTSLTDQIASAQLDPMVAELLQSATGIDFPGAIGTSIRQQSFQRGFQEHDYVRVPDGQGGYNLVKMPKYSSPGAEGTLVGSQPAKPESFQVQTPQGTFRQTVNPFTQQPVGGQQVAPPSLESFVKETPEGKFRETVNKLTQEAVKTKKVGKIKGVASDTASKMALATNAVKHIKNLNDMFIKKDGSINRELIFTSNLPMGGLGEGRTAYATFVDALDARARAATGAAMPESEIRNYTRIYFPSVLDNDATIKDKLKRLENFMNDFLTTMDPSEEIRNRLKKGKKEDPLGIR